MGRLAKIARTQLRTVVELAITGKMVRENPVSQFAKCNPKLAKDSQKIPKDSKVC